MDDPYIRHLLLYAIGGAVVAVLLVAAIRHRREAKWRRLRLRGDARAKERELSRHGRKRRRT